jgi:hypothetical protein
LCHNIRMPDGPCDAAPRLLQNTSTKCAAASTAGVGASRLFLRCASPLLQLPGPSAAGAAGRPAACMPLLGPGAQPASGMCANLLAASAPGHASAIGSATSRSVPSTTPATSPFSRSPVCSSSQARCLISQLTIVCRCRRFALSIYPLQHSNDTKMQYVWPLDTTCTAACVTPECHTCPKSGSALASSSHTRQSSSTMRSKPKSSKQRGSGKNVSSWDTASRHSPVGTTSPVATPEHPAEHMCRQLHVGAGPPRSRRWIQGM